MYESGDQAKKGTNQELEFLASMTSEERDLLLGRVQPFMKLMMQYRCAIREMETKLQVLMMSFPCSMSEIHLSPLRVVSKNR